METIDAATVADRTPWTALIEAIADALAEGDVISPERHVHDLAPMATADDDPLAGANLLLMPSWRSGDVIVVKTVVYVPTNAQAGRPTVQAAVLAFDGATGEPLAAIDGDALTARRTAAASGLAARHLAKSDAERLVLVGTGQLAPNLARVHATVRPLTDIAVWGRNPDRAAATAERLAAEGLPARPADDLEAEVERADIVSCATGATEPIIRGSWLAPGSHLDLVGGFHAGMREADDDALVGATIAVDTVAGAGLAGDLVQPLRAKVIEPDDIVADLADLATGRHPGRTDAAERTVFKSAGFALLDFAAARLALGPGA